MNLQGSHSVLHVPTVTNVVQLVEKKDRLALKFLPLEMVPPSPLSWRAGVSGVVQNVKEQQRHRERLQPPYPCECRFGSAVPLGCLQQANYRASVTRRRGAEGDWKGGGGVWHTERLRQIIRLGAARLPPRYSFTSKSDST